MGGFVSKDGVIVGIQGRRRKMVGWRRQNAVCADGRFNPTNTS